MRVPLGQNLKLEIKQKATAPLNQVMNNEVVRMREDPRLHEIIQREACKSEREYELVQELLRLNRNWFGRHIHGSYNERYDIHMDNGPTIQVELSCAGTGHGAKQWENQPKAIREYMINESAKWMRAKADAEKIAKSLDLIFENCSTVQQAEKVLPTIINWLPEEAMDRYRQKASKRSPTPDFDAIKNDALDSDTIAAMTRSKMSE